MMPLICIRIFWGKLWAPLWRIEKSFRRHNFYSLTITIQYIIRKKVEWNGISWFVFPTAICFHIYCDCDCPDLSGFMDHHTMLCVHELDTVWGWDGSISPMASGEFLVWIWSGLVWSGRGVVIKWKWLIAVNSEAVNINYNFMAFEISLAQCEGGSCTAWAGKLGRAKYPLKKQIWGKR